MADKARVIAFERLRMGDVGEVGGKNASLGEMIGELGATGVRVPSGFATTAFAFREFLAANKLDTRIAERLAGLDVDDVRRLAEAGSEIRGWISDAPLPPALIAAIKESYGALVAGDADASWAVRSSATAEDLPDASFAGQQETYLNIKGLENILHAIKEVFSSLYNDRAIAYRVHQGFVHADVALSAGVQRMVRSDLGASGVMFTLDTESGFDQVVFITASYGLGETVVQGSVNPDEFYLYKPNLLAGRPALLRKSVGTKVIKMVFADEHSATKSTVTVDVDETERHRFAITDAEAHELARYATLIEKHYGRPMDIEWAVDKDLPSGGNIFILQARPETVWSAKNKAAVAAAGGSSAMDYILSGMLSGKKVS
jgi:pyruvate,water dikinase